MLGSLNNDGVQDPYYENGAVQLCGRDSTLTSRLCIEILQQITCNNPNSAHPSLTTETIRRLRSCV
jgi:hypothetical protein